MIPRRGRKCRGGRRHRQPARGRARVLQPIYAPKSRPAFKLGQL
jgi:hypothetical protein